MSPRVYLAGKIDKNDWRHRLVPGLRDHLIDDGPLRTESFIYMGPFFISCDHGCFHGPNKHGVRGGCSEGALTELQIIERSYAAIRSADLIFAYITAQDCLGTVNELTYAMTIGKPVVMAFARGVSSREFWFTARTATAVHINITDRTLPSLLQKELAKTQTTRKLGGVGSFGTHNFNWTAHE